MLSVAKISSKLARKIAEKTGGNDEKRQVIEYGIFSFIQTVIAIGLVVVFGIIFRVLVAAMIMSFTISILRKYSGGVHASTPLGCSIIGTFICIVGPIILKECILNYKYIIVLGIIIFISSYYLIFKYAPKDCKNKRLKNEAKKKRLKRKSIKLITFYLIIVLIFIYVYKVSSRTEFLLYTGSMYMGIVWQVFSITKLGDIVLTKLDFLLNKLIYIRRN